MTDAGNQNFVKPNSFYLLFVVDISVIILLIFIWKRIWLNTHQLYVPDAKFIDYSLKGRIPEDQHNRVYFYEITHLFRVIKRIVTQFDPEYIIKHLGFEAYSYLAFLRRIVKTLAILCILDVCIWIPYLSFFGSPQNFSLITMESSGHPNFRTTYSIIISSVILYSLHSLKRQLRYRLRYHMVSSLTEDKEGFSSQRDIVSRKSTLVNWLTLRTVNVQILSNHNSPTAPTQIRQYLQKFLNIDCQCRAMIADLVPIPDFGDLLSTKYELEYYETVKQMIEDERLPLIWRYLTLNSVESVDQKIAQLKRVVVEQSSKNVHSAVGAFMVVTTMQGVRILTSTFGTNSQIKCCRKSVVQAQFNSPYEFTVRNAQNCQDIVWTNMQYTRSGFKRSVIINLLCIAVLVFISTPATVLNLIKIEPILATLSVMLTNTVLSILLSTMVYQQRHIFQSHKETRQFIMQVFYLSMNNILVTIMRSIKNVIELFLLKDGWKWIEVFQLAYKRVDGYFFCTMFINQTASAFAMSLIKPAELFENYGSPSLFVYKSKINRNNAYGRNQNFQFGYFYAQTVMLFSIAVLFSCSIPLIHAFALIFFMSRYYLDTYTLLTFHREECQSLGTLVSTILFSVAISVIVQLFLVANSLLIEQRYINAIVLYSVLFISVYVATELVKPLLNDIDIITDPEYKDIKIKNVHLEEWRHLYTHPLMRRI